MQGFTGPSRKERLVQTAFGGGGGDPYHGVAQGRVIVQVYRPSGHCCREKTTQFPPPATRQGCRRMACQCAHGLS